MNLYFFGKKIMIKIIESQCDLQKHSVQLLQLVLVV